MLKRGWRPPPLNNEQAQRLLDDMELQHYMPTLTLSPGELRALTLMAYGNTEPEAAEKIGRAYETVRSQTKNAREKLAARNTTHAVAIAIDGGLIYSDTGWREAA